MRLCVYLFFIGKVSTSTDRLCKDAKEIVGKIKPLTQVHLYKWDSQLKKILQENASKLRACLTSILQTTRVDDAVCLPGSFPVHFNLCE